MSAIASVNPDASHMGSAQSLMVNVSAAKGLASVVCSNLGPKGTLKMLVGGAGQIKLTKDGAVLLGEMQIQHPTAQMIARSATAQDVYTGDGTTTVVLLIGELLSRAQALLLEGVHPRVIQAGFVLAKERCSKFLDSMAKKIDDVKTARDLLLDVARTSLRTKLEPKLAESVTEIVVDACLAIHPPAEAKDQQLDLHMVEMIHMIHRRGEDSRLVKGLVLDHGARHPDMPKRLENCYVMTANVSLEYEKTEASSGFYYANAVQREKLVASERKFTDEKVKKIIELKRKVCTPENKKSFVLINQKGIDPLSLDALAKEGIFAARRAKRRNMERLSKSCGGYAVNSVDDLTPDCLGECEELYEVTLGEEKFTFMEGCKYSKSVTVLVTGPDQHTIAQIKGAVRDGLRNIKNVFDDKSVIPGAGAYEIAAYADLMEFKKSVKGKEKLGVQAFADALLIVPKTLALNSGLDIQETLIAVQSEHEESKINVGIDVDSGDAIDPLSEGIIDNYRVKKQAIHLSEVIASQLLLVDEVIKAGRKMGKDKD